MKPPPADPFALHARIMDALIADIRDSRAAGFPRVDALRQRLRATDERLPKISHARACSYVTEDGPAPCTCDFYEREQAAISELDAAGGEGGE